SGEPTGPGWESSRIARAWAVLMDRLNYTRYVAQGGDVGATVTDAMGRQAPAALLGIHLTSRHSPPRSGLPRAAGSRRSAPTHVLQRGRQGRPLRRLGRARAVLRGGPRGLQVTPVAGHRGHPRKRQRLVKAT